MVRAIHQVSELPLGLAPTTFTETSTPQRLVNHLPSQGTNPPSPVREDRTHPCRPNCIAMVGIGSSRLPQGFVSLLHLAVDSLLHHAWYPTRTVWGSLAQQPVAGLLSAACPRLVVQILG